MAEPRRLTPRKVSIEANLKLFTLQTGISTGSSITVEFDVPDGLDPAELKDELYREKEQLDATLLTMELVRESLSREDYDRMRRRQRGAYDILLKRKPKDEH
jgi:hypothetical protein